MSGFAIVIPARFESTRFPGKPLCELRGVDGTSKTLIRRSWECATEVEGCSGVWVATDDERIATEVRRFGGECIMTSPACRNGTERCAEASSKLDCDADIIVNLQGDAPLTPSDLVRPLVERLIGDPDAAMATPAVRCTQSSLAHLQADDRAGRVGGTTAVFDRDDRALYFSKRILPYLAPDHASARVPVFLHLGLYAYRREALQAYVEEAPSDLEQLEGLEQLRFLDMGLKVLVHPVEQYAWDPIELNNPSDVDAIERALVSRGMA